MAEVEKMTTDPSKALGHGCPAHGALVRQAQAAKRSLMFLMESGSRDFEVMADLFGEYRSYLLAADLVSGQA